MKILNLCKSFDDKLIINQLSMDFEPYEIAVILGPSGCGKTTLLNIIAGLVSKDNGEIQGFEDKQLSYVFQEPRLLLNKTVYENIAFVLKGTMSQRDMKDRIMTYLELTGLETYKDYYPSKLSGGLRQRVSLVRAFTYDSDVILLDEPFQSLDLEVKLNLIKSFKKLWQYDKKTVIFVTHDIKASALLGDSVFILEDQPTFIKKKINNYIDIDEREPYNDKVLEFEKEIASILLK